MKVIGTTQAVLRNSETLDISGHIATALGARNDATLYAVGFRRNVLELSRSARVDTPEYVALVTDWQWFLKEYDLTPTACSMPFLDERRTSSRQS